MYRNLTRGFAVAIPAPDPTRRRAPQACVTPPIRGPKVPAPPEVGQGRTCLLRQAASALLGSFRSLARARGPRPAGTTVLAKEVPRAASARPAGPPGPGPRPDLPGPSGIGHPPSSFPPVTSEAQVNSLSLFEIGAVPASELCRAGDRVPDPIALSLGWRPLWGPQRMARRRLGRRP